jgi:hypothetical protein
VKLPSQYHAILQHSTCTRSYSTQYPGYLPEKPFAERGFVISRSLNGLSLSWVRGEGNTEVTKNVDGRVDG